MMDLLATAGETLSGVTGYIYPNEYELHWSILIVVYPYLRGWSPARRIGLAGTSFQSNGVAAGLPPVPAGGAGVFDRSAAAAVGTFGSTGAGSGDVPTPHTSSAMAMFGFVYAWYLMVVLLLEIWFDYRRDFVCGRTAVAGCASSSTKS